MLCKNLCSGAIDAYHKNHAALEVKIPICSSQALIAGIQLGICKTVYIASKNTTTENKNNIIEFRDWTAIVWRTWWSSSFCASSTYFWVLRLWCSDIGCSSCLLHWFGLSWTKSTSRAKTQNSCFPLKRMAFQKTTLCFLNKNGGRMLSSDNLMRKRITVNYDKDFAFANITRAPPVFLGYRIQGPSSTGPWMR